MCSNYYITFEIRVWNGKGIWKHGQIRKALEVVQISWVMFLWVWVSVCVSPGVPVSQCLTTNVADA